LPRTVLSASAWGILACVSPIVPLETEGVGLEILVVEDNRTLAVNIRRYLELEHYAASVCFDGQEGLNRALSEPYDCIILDLDLPGMHGLEICRRLRTAGNASPILILTASGTKPDVVRGLDAGADDYLVKPFDMEELLARVRTLVRRRGTVCSPVLSAVDVTLDSNTHEVRRGGTIVRLAPKEYALLDYLMRNLGVVQDRRSIVAHVWGEHSAQIPYQTVDVHVAYLRRKLGKDLIRTVPGKGYYVVG
jgi:two-component system copper resistance phosphate regulon response regulator CusR